MREAERICNQIVFPPLTEEQKKEIESFKVLRYEDNDTEFQKKIF